MIDQIGGWSTAGVGQSYGEGYSLDASSEVVKEYCLTSILQNKNLALLSS
jgi:hypothetical protein